ncbi:hypothetical protein DFH07DRAFT_1064505 [Mycena maculata]|uniref:Uncharacterized protein n=1 Tax=Mycena maculata TaxID=230809 RepID=A0AAD7IB67_9AGAR|nr:hypothetical protein DFH07DRAFT_1064505 [Mycena maculata]
MPDTPRTRPFWSSPAYPALVGNALAEYLSLSHHPFPELEAKIRPYPSLANTASGGLATHAQMWHGPVGYQGKAYWRVVVRPYIDLSAVKVCGVLLSFPIRVSSTSRPSHATFKSSGKQDLEFLGGSTLTDIDPVVLGAVYSAASAPLVRVLQPPTLSLSTTQPQTLTPLTSASTSPP